MGERKGGGEVNYEMGFPEDAPMKPPGGFLNPFGGPFLNFVLCVFAFVCEIVIS